MTIETQKTILTYGGKDGRVSRRDTRVEDSILAEGPPGTFTQSFTWDALSNRV